MSVVVSLLVSTLACRLTTHVLSIERADWIGQSYTTCLSPVDSFPGLLCCLRLAQWCNHLPPGGHLWHPVATLPHRWHSRQRVRPLHARPSLDYTMNSSRYYHMLTFLVESALHNCIYNFLCLPGTSELTLFIHKPSKLTCGILMCCIFHDHKPIVSIRKITQKWCPQRLLKYEENM